jgi:transposase
MTRFPTAGHLVSWARLCPRTIQSATKNNAGKAGKAGKGNPYLKGVLGLAAATAARSGGSFLAERYRRVVNAAARARPSSPSPAPSW